MTALAGFWNRGIADGPDRCAAMLAAQAIYGPQPPLQRRLDDVTLGRRLFPTAMRDDADRGPVVGGEGALLLIADVRIDNRDELITKLSLGQEPSRTASDPALLMALVERGGIDAITSVVGAFAIVLWDMRAQTLHLARDPMGERPLHYHRGTSFVAVASMPKGLHTLSEIPYRPNSRAVSDFLALLPETDGDSFFDEIERVPPATIVSITPDRVSARRWWDPKPTILRWRDSRQYEEALRFELDRAVACRLDRAGGHIGAHLSAGLDSSSVAATAARQLAPEQLHAYTAVAAGSAGGPLQGFADESKLAAATADLHANIRHTIIRAGGSTSPLAGLDRQFFLFERPLLNLCNTVWGEAINNAARAAGVSVMLTGDMGNYTISHGGLQLLPQLLRNGRLIALATLVRRLRLGGRSYRTIVATTVGPFLPFPLWGWLSDRFDRSYSLASYTFIRPDAIGLGVKRAEAKGMDLTYRPWANGLSMRRWALSRRDAGMYNKGTLAGWGIDSRDPTADRRLIEFALSVPEEQHILAGVPRSLARRAFADRLPPAVIAERRHGVQAADWHVGLSAARSEVAAELDSYERCAPAEQLLDVERMRAALNDWPEGGWTDRQTVATYRMGLLRGVAAGHFLRKVERTN